MTATNRFFNPVMDRCYIGDEILLDNFNYNIEMKDIDIHNKMLTFDFIRPNGFFCLTVLHNGNLSISGDLKNGRIRKLKVYDASSIKKLCIFAGCSSLLQFLTSFFYILSDLFRLSISALTTVAIIMSVIQIYRICVNKWNGYNLQSIQDGILKEVKQYKGESNSDTTIQKDSYGR